MKKLFCILLSALMLLSVTAGLAEKEMKAIEQVLAEYPNIDKDRIYVGGCSMGGGGTMSIITAYPDFFAAAFPICPAGSLDEETAAKFAANKMPVYLIHSIDDNTVNVSSSAAAYELLTKAGAEVHTTLFEHALTIGVPEEICMMLGHWSWTYVHRNFDAEGEDEDGRMYHAGEYVASGVNTNTLYNGEPLDYGKLNEGYSFYDQSTSIQNIRHKTDEELRQLRTAGIHGLDIGVGSGLDAALTYMNKGHTAEEARQQLLRLTKAGMDYSFNAILGCGGAELWKENADATARLINAVQPQLLFIGSLHAEPGCRLFQDMKTGIFKECTIGQLLDEQERLLCQLDLRDTYYFGSHPSNIVPMQGYLPDQKQDMIDAIRETREQLQAHLNEYPKRGGEGAILKR